MIVQINGVLKNCTEQEVEYLKSIYGYWEQEPMLTFTKPEFLTVVEMAKLLKVGRGTIYKRNERDSIRYPLIRKGGITGIDVDNFLSKWL
jgi:excisionase family DNA binding protein